MALLLMLASGAALVWIYAGPLGQRGRAIRAERHGKPNSSFIISMLAALAIIVALIATHSL